MATSPRARTLRWFAPLAMVAVIALIAAIPNLSAADTPTLAPVTAQQLIAKVRQADVKALSGTIELTTNLGIPNLGALSDAAASGGGGGRHGGGGNGFNPTDLLSGSHQALVWQNGAERSRVALLQSMAEVDVVHNGHDVWTWDSTTKKVTHAVLPAHTSPAANDSKDHDQHPVQTPAQMAQNLLDRIGPSTATSITSTDYVADQPVYRLVLTPKLPASTIAQVTIAVDANTGLPLQVEVFAKGQKSAALRLGFSSISYAVPAASNFNFTPPPGSTVTTRQPTAHAGPAKAEPAAGTPDPTPTTAAENPTVVGQDWGTVAIFSGVKLPAQAGEFLRAATPVQGAFGTGRLVESSLVNVLVLDDGRIAMGAVSSAALEAAVASAH